MLRNNDRILHDSDFDNRFVQMVRANPELYDVRHPNYRRNPIRISIWNRMSKELNVPSKFLQTKWKNIRYKYLQEIKCIETGHSIANVRKRCLTEDLSFLLNTAQSYKIKKRVSLENSLNGSDDSNSNMYPDLKQNAPNSVEVIEIEHSDDGMHSSEENSSNNIIPNNLEQSENSLSIDQIQQVAYRKGENDLHEFSSLSRLKQSSLQNLPKFDKSHYVDCMSTPPTYPSNPSSPLTTPMVVIGNDQDDDYDGRLFNMSSPDREMHKHMPLPPLRPKNGAILIHEHLHARPSEIMLNIPKSRETSFSFPPLNPLNDPIKMYCLSLVDCFRNMPRSERERVKFEFAKILKDAKYMNQN